MAFTRRIGDRVVEAFALPNLGSLRIDQNLIPAKVSVAIVNSR